MQSKITIQVHKYSSKASLNKNVFKFFLKLGKDGERRTSDGNEFHKVAAANLKDRSPQWLRDWCSARSSWFEDLRPLHSGTITTIVNILCGLHYVHYYSDVALYKCVVSHHANYVINDGMFNE